MTFTDLKIYFYYDIILSVCNNLEFENFLLLEKTQTATLSRKDLNVPESGMSIKLLFILPFKKFQSTFYILQLSSKLQNILNFFFELGSPKAGGNVFPCVCKYVYCCNV